ncbi:MULTISPECIES: efflux RND transporter permease subunit [Acidobacteriaceae]|uniref:efflux RND transporter permease subunit n=1 Tax=Acidobacteriaceae TaxID=204434 RepID=UPI00131D4248|nr:MULTISPECIES: CusA/CzcA family heavy metal efflux RND transporter [Acidobacteriaceae]MDW5265678.1 CusA/CzcA family heavy metal efflux RND transporter [Edaphobacter sp.]
MQPLIRLFIRYRTIILILFFVMLALGGFLVTRLDIEAYPDPSPPLVEIITQNPSWSAEEMEQQVTVPVETTINGTPHLDQVRSISIFGLSDVKLYFDFDSDSFRDRQEVLNRLQTLSLPNNLQPQLSPWSPIGEIFRYQLVGHGYTLNEIKATQDWLVRRELKQVPGVIDITTFGGTTRQYQIEADPNKLLSYGVTLPQVINAVQSSNANAGGNYLQLGNQNVNVRAVGQVHTAEDIGAIVVAEKNGTPITVRDIGTVSEGFQPRLGQVGRDKQNDIVLGIVLLQKDEKSLPTLKALKEKITSLNAGSLLPPGMKISTIYDRTTLINQTTHTVRDIIITGLILVTLVLLSMLGDLRITFIAAVTIPFAVLFAFGMMVLAGRSANLISIGAIDFGILVDASIIVLESIYRKLSRRIEGEETGELIVEGVTDAARPVLFSTGIIVVAFIPLFTMQGVAGQIFSPMSVTYGFALLGALLFALVFAPVLGYLTAPTVQKVGDGYTWLSRSLRHGYEKVLHRTLRHPKSVWMGAAIMLLAGVLCFIFVGGEFMPPLEEGNLWIRATLPQDISFDTSATMANQIRAVIAESPEVTQTVSQMGRPDDGTDVSTFNNIEVSVALKPADKWRPGLTKPELIEEMNNRLSRFPGIELNFSQNIQDNVEEAMSGVKGENSLKLFGDDFDTLTSLADKIETVMKSVPGVADVGVFKVGGQPSLIIQTNRAKAARYGVLSADINAAVQAAIGGAPVTQVIQGDRRFDLTVRYPEGDRSSPDAIRAILIPTADGGSIPLGQVADVSIREGSFMIYREGGRRYIPIKFSVRGRDLSTTINDLQGRLKQQVKLPTGYDYTWAGEFDSLKKEQRRLAVIIPISLAIIVVLLFIQFNTWKDAFIIIATLPFAAVGGAASLFVTRTPFSISAAVGFTSLIGVATLGAVVFMSGVRRAQRESITEDGRTDKGLEEGCIDEMRPVVMACLAAGLGLLPASLSNGIGAQAQQPLARVVVGGMITTIIAILFILPLLLRQKPQRREDEAA